VENIVDKPKLRTYINSWQTRLLCVGLAAAMSCAALSNAQDNPLRKVRSRVEPAYPDLAKKMSISGIVRMQVVVGANGNVRDAKVVGGHPLLINAAEDAVKKWKFEPASADSKEIIEFKFAPQ
jgi:TonB family protein